MLKVDNREPEKIFKLLDKFEIPYEKVELPVGDFLLEEKGICIERKSITDFISSLWSKHLHKQLLQMEQNYPNNFLIVSGDVKDLFFQGSFLKINVENWIGSLVSILVRFNIKLLMVQNDAQLVRAVKKICEKVGDGKTITIKDTELLKNKLTKEDIFIKLLTCYPRIGIKKAEKLLKENKEIADILELMNSIIEKNLKEKEKKD